MAAAGSVAVVSLLVGGVMLVNAAGMGAAGPRLSAVKQAVVDRETAEQARLQALLQRAKPAYQPAFLPNPAPNHAPSIRPYRGFGPFKGGAYMTNIAWVVASSRVDYTVYAGAMDADPQQGILLVLRGAGPPDYIGGSTALLYRWPSRVGVLTIESIAGDTLLVQAQDGSQARFNLVTGQFLR
jgi:hypothetical protein